MELAIGIILIVAALFLIIAVLMQHGKDHNFLRKVEVDHAR